MSGCDVCIGGYDGSVEFFFSDTVTCRKPTKCSECGQAEAESMTDENIVKLNVPPHFRKGNVWGDWY